MLLHSQRLGLVVAVLLLVCAGLYAQQEKKKSRIELPEGVPAKVGKVLAYVDEQNKAMDNYEGGRNFGNFERLLPQKTIRAGPCAANGMIRAPRRQSRGRRLITGSGAYYTE